MASAASAVPQIAPHVAATGSITPGHAIAARLAMLIQRLCDPYRPERHYMRGPGPKWHAKHGKNGPV